MNLILGRIRPGVMFDFSFPPPYELDVDVFSAYLYASARFPIHVGAVGDSNLSNVSAKTACRFSRFQFFFCRINSYLVVFSRI